MLNSKNQDKKTQKNMKKDVRGFERRRKNVVDSTIFLISIRINRLDLDTCMWKTGLSILYNVKHVSISRTDENNVFSQSGSI